MRHAVERKIVKNLQDLARICEKIRSEKLKISCTNGVFDILHDGHLNYLLTARSVGDILVVGVDNDTLVKKNKGKNRPILPEKIRAYLIAGFECVDIVCIIDSSNSIINLIKTEVFIMSKSTGDIKCRSKQIDFIRSYGGEVVILKPLSEKSTTKIIEKIRKNN